MRRFTAVLAVVLLGGALGAAPVTLARFHDTADSTATFHTATIAPPTALAASVSTTTVTLTWTPSTTAAVEGYVVFRGGVSGGPYTEIATVTPRGATTTTDAPGAGTWYYVLRAFAGTWTSVRSDEASATVSTTTSTGLKGCGAQAADTGGRNNGYEGDPTRGCATDNQPAVDANSGTNTSLSCTDAGKDRHRFWNFGLGVPSGASAINGISVQLVAGMNNNGGTSLICAQLSWDGGTTWTALKSVTLTTTGFTTYTLGGTGDTWGRTWTASQLANASFRVRLVDVTSQPSKDFRLDSVQVGVTYTP